MISLAHSCLWILGVSLHISGSLSPSLEILRIIAKKQTYKRALQRIYLERTCVHACIQLCTRGYTVVYTWVYSCVHVGIQLCTRGYTVVYTWVHSSLLPRRDSLGISRLGYRYFYLRSMLLDDLALAL